MEDMKEAVGKTPTICFPSVTIVVPTCCRVGFARLDEANFDGAESGRFRLRDGVAVSSGQLANLVTILDSLHALVESAHSPSLLATLMTFNTRLSVTVLSRITDQNGALRCADRAPLVVDGDLNNGRRACE